MNLIEVVKLAKESKKIRRSSWPETEYVYSFEFYRSVEENDVYMTWGFEFPEDWEEEDWEISEEEFKTYNFQEALEALNEGKLIRKLSDLSKENDRGFLYKEEDYIRAPDDDEDVPCDEKIFSYNDLYATDWLIVDRNSHPLRKRNE